MKIKNHPLILLVISIIFLNTGCRPNEKTPLVVLSAGSLIIPFKELEIAFEASHPEIDVVAQYHGSIQDIRHATELHEKIDVVATADHALISKLMYDSVDIETGKPFASWYLRFATNRLAIAFTSESKHATEITQENWYEVLSRPYVKVGIADPRFDACGYRTLMVFQLADDYYDNPPIFFDRFGGNFTNPINVSQENGISIIHIPEIIEAKPESGIVIRGGSVQLLALLESGDLDYAFEYESVIQQHNLQMVQLPPELNLGEEGFVEDYGKVQVVMDFQRFSTIKLEFNGERIGYGITIPTNAPHPKEAAEFLAFLLGAEGKAIMAENFHPMFDPVSANNYNAVPVALQSFCVPEPQP